MSGIRNTSSFTFCFFLNLQRLLTDAGPDSTVFLTSGYFNLTRAYMRLVLGAGASYRILTASPEVNGFFGAKGVAGAIPAAYIHIARQFYNQVCRLGQQERVHLHEYHRSQWTFHAKGGMKRKHTYPTLSNTRHSHGGCNLRSNPVNYFFNESFNV